MLHSPIHRDPTVVLNDGSSSSSSPAITATTQLQNGNPIIDNREDTAVADKNFNDDAVNDNVIGEYWAQCNCKEDNETTLSDVESDTELTEGCFSEYDDDGYDYDDDDYDPDNYNYYGLPADDRKITIRFNDDCLEEIHTCLHIRDYTDSERSDAWYQCTERYNMIELARKTAADAAELEQEREDAGTTTATTKSEVAAVECCTRGLETLLNPEPTRHFKDTFIQFVWFEQSKQWEEGVFDPEAIRAVYVKVSKDAASVARQREIQDAAEITKAEVAKAVGLQSQTLVVSSEEITVTKRRLVGRSHNETAEDSTRDE